MQRKLERERERERTYVSLYGVPGERQSVSVAGRAVCPACSDIVIILHLTL